MTGRQRILTTIAALVAATVGCGSKTGLSADDREEVVDAGPLPDLRCEDGTDGSPFTVVDGIAMARAAVGGRVWYGEINFNAAVGWLPRDGGTPVEIRAEEPVVNGFVGEARRAHWLSVGLGDTTGELRSWTAGEMRVLARGLFWPGSLHAAGDHFYFADGTNSGSLRDEMRGRVLRVPRSGGDIEVLAEGLWLPTDVAILGDFVFWVDTRRGQLGRVRRTGGAPEILVDDLAGPRHLVADESALFFAVDDQLFAMDADGGTELVGAYGDQIDHVAVDRVGFFITLRDRGANHRLVFVDRSFGPEELVEDGGRAAVTDETRVYWSVGVGFTDPAIRAVCKARFR